MEVAALKSDFLTGGVIFAAEAERVTRLGDAPSSVAAALGAAILPFVTGKGTAGFVVVGPALAVGDGSGSGDGPTAYAGDTTPTTNAAETKTVKTALRRKTDNHDSSRGFEARTSEQNKAVLTGN
jgi:hypothetical protein